MELRHLRYFVAVAEELNFRKASERLRVAQPALSTQIKDLEYDLGVRLLNRDTGGVRLTDAGAAFLAEARAILAHAEEAAIIAREAAQGRRGRLTVGYFAPLIMGFMPASLKIFHTKYPDVEVVLVEMPPTRQLPALEAGEIQIGFRLGEGPPLPAGMADAAVVRSPICAVMGRSHRLARAKRVALIDLAREPILCLGGKDRSASLHGTLIRRLFTSRGLKIGQVQAIDGTESFRAHLESELGVSFMSEVGGLAHSQKLSTKSLKETGSDLYMELHAVWREDHHSQLTANFITVLRDTATSRRRKRP